MSGWINISSKINARLNISQFKRFLESLSQSIKSMSLLPTIPWIHERSFNCRYGKRMSLDGGTCLYKCHVPRIGETKSNFHYPGFPDSSCCSSQHCRSAVFVSRLTRWASLVEQELLNLPEHLSSPPVVSGVRVTSFLCSVLQIVVSTFSFGHCVVCSSSIYGFLLSPFVIFKHFVIVFFMINFM